MRQSSEQVANSCYIPPSIGTIDVITSRCAPNFFRSLIFLPFPFALKPYYLHYYISFNGCLSGNFRTLTILHKGYLTILEKSHDSLFRSIEIDSTSPSKL